ncbi:MAG: ABC transporter ATP-binding protein [Clostridia bacterium]|nr:ABC transporter ATP-binding protein [Clostridia bacterium]MBQ8512181.1 ABC transporter ATP-binding protein [Clostridia bacterium]
MILEAKDLTRVYVQGDDTIRAVDGCNLTVNEGDFITITGSSGCGKSTLLGLLGGIDTPDGGKVYLDGESMYDAADDRLSDIRAQKIGFVFQNFSLLPTLTAAENIRLPCLISGKSFSRFYFDELCEMLGIAHRLNHFPSAMSGGEQQRVAVARALICRPRLLLADEPTGSLDRASADNLLGLIVKMQKELKQTCIMVTHDEKIAAAAPIRKRMENGILR